ncbi:hypothetical protein GJ744_001948 [Endocarpon pusillum]|uniref:Beta-ketoacyl-[acyl-carrier-protein] synthase I n=1 Tax=Endocarpon pusillum TaxID=364733 RepID=A0A8H7E8I4_9EURO|nr:hypothetical protein GJ744_001948 [Endocarpon pusillum]
MAMHAPETPALSRAVSRSEQDQRYARVLLVELLAHQFCFPVQWIETQNLILGSRRTERLVEIGPSNTLATMAKRTIDLKYRSKDMAQNVSRQLLSFNSDVDKISYEEQPVPTPTKSQPVPTPTKSQQPVAETTAKQPQNSIPIPGHGLVTAIVAHSSSEIEDVPVSAQDVVTTIVAASLKKPLEDLQMSKSIKALSGGRSTLQNEIIGDLAAEFGSMPDGAEDLPLEILCNTLQSTFTGALGKKSSALVDKLISSKSPGTFQITAIRKYLQTRWGMGPGRQNAILLWAVTVQPDFRLKNEDEAQIFLDSVVQVYISKTGIKLPLGEASANTGGSTAGMVDPKALEFLETKQKSLFQQQLQIYANELGVDLQANDATVASLKDRIAELEKQVDLWNSEHGEVYASGIKPLFSPLKARIFDSWWNWATQDLLLFISRLKEGSIIHGDDDFRDFRTGLLNRSHSGLTQVMQFLLTQAQSSLLRQILQQLILDCESATKKAPSILRDPVSMAPMTVIDANGKVTYKEKLRSEGGSMHSNSGFNLRLGRKACGCWQYDEVISQSYNKMLQNASTHGFSFAHKTVLLTGAGQGSIGAEILRCLLRAGAYVIVTTSSYSSKITRYYQELYAHFGARGSQLVLVPFNQASQKDVEAVVTYIYDRNGLSQDLDFVLPFAAIGEAGRELDNIDSKSELAHRLMLTNTLRLLGAIKKKKVALRNATRPAHVILPMSPNHGVFGNDGLYSESKLGLESLFEKWHSENWGDHLAICGAIIGWTRGTGLMSGNDIISEEVEKLGVRTFSQREMAFNILGLMSPSILPLSMVEPLVADLSGGMSSLARLKETTDRIRQSINQTSEERRAIAKEADLQKHAAGTTEAAEKLANLEFPFPSIPDYERQIRPLSRELGGMVDLDRVVVVVGFAEIGPYGNSRTRWQVEADGRLSREGCVEMAWLMGLIKSHSGIIDGEPFAGWVDKATGNPISDQGIKTKYEEHMMKYSGIRHMEPKGVGIDWDSKELLQEIEVQRDHDPFETSEQAAQDLKRAHGDKVVITQIPDTSIYMVVVKKGARILVPKVASSPNTVGGQIPKGWNPRAYGVPEDIINQVDPATLYVLVSAAEALQSAGILDPYELYEYIHISDFGNCVGSGLGGATSYRSIFRDRFEDKPVANDVLAESFINSPSAWVNMLLISSAGPNKTPVGACATAIESLDTGYDLITSGKAKICLVGGYDDLIRETNNEFSNIKATINPAEDMARGRDPKEMSRPATSTRKGFVESEGAGLELITSATLALEMGLPIYGVIALTQTASDKTGRSLPAPGQGILGAAAQTKGKFDSRLLDMKYRKRNVEMRRAQISEIKESQLAYLEEEELNAFGCKDTTVHVEYRAQRVKEIERDAERELKEALNLYGNHFWKHDTRISPIRGALAVWNLTVDDLDVISFHGTSTKANERNECGVIQQQLAHLGRTKGNVVPGVFQKYLTGHPKGAAGAWMLNGCLQIMEQGLIPGNRNADNIEDHLKKFDYLVFPNKSIRTPEIKAFSVTSFGFGQKGAQVIGVHPKYLYATLEESVFRDYEAKVQIRHKKASRKFHEGLANNSVFVAKDSPPYTPSQESNFLLDPDARLPKST